MTNRTTIRDLELQVERINALTKSPQAPWADGRANVGNYHLSSCYGKWQLQRMANTGGGCETPLGRDFGSKKDLLAKLRAFVCGLETR